MRPIFASIACAAVALGSVAWLGPDLVRDIAFRGEASPALGARIETAKCRQALVVAFCSVGYRDALAGGRKGEVTALMTGWFGGESVRLVREGAAGPITTDVALSHTGNRALTLSALFGLCAFGAYRGARMSLRPAGEPRAA